VVDIERPLIKDMTISILHISGFRCLMGVPQKNHPVVMVISSMDPRLRESRLSQIRSCWDMDMGQRAFRRCLDDITTMKAWMNGWNGNGK
jgi:hypothetical protein